MKNLYYKFSFPLYDLLVLCLNSLGVLKMNEQIEELKSKLKLKKVRNFMSYSLKIDPWQVKIKNLVKDLTN